MPRFNEVAPTATSTPQKPDFKPFWTKAKTLADTGESFCIDAIMTTKEPDIYGKHAWIVRGITSETSADVRMFFNLPMSPERDKFMKQLITIIEQSKKDGDDGILHGCFVESVETPARGKAKMNNTFLLKALDDDALEASGGCACLLNTNMETDHPF